MAGLEFADFGGVVLVLVARESVAAVFVVADVMADVMAEAMPDVMAEVAEGVTAENEMEERAPAPALVSVSAVVVLVKSVVVMPVPSVVALVVSLASGRHRAYRRPTELGEAKFPLNQGHRARRHPWGSPGPASRNTTISPSNFASISSPLT